VEEKVEEGENDCAGPAKKPPVVVVVVVVVWWPHPRRHSSQPTRLAAP